MKKFTMVNVNNLELGEIVAKDIFVNTRYPIVAKNTPISSEHLQVFKAFNIKEIPVLVESIEKTASNKSNKEDVKSENEIVATVENEKVTTNDSFEKEYLEKVEIFKAEFKNWEAGKNIEIIKIREIISPLIKLVLEDRSFLFDLNHYSNPIEYIYHHCISTGLIAATLANKMGFDRGNTLQIGIAGVLADCGMAKVPIMIRNKKAPLTAEDVNEIRKHPIYSYNMVKELSQLKNEMKIAILQHHERLDGSGYPIGLKMERISHLGQIIAVADTFHAMTCDRLYRPKESLFKVIEMIKDSEFGKFDIQVVNTLTNLVAELPIGTKVELSNSEKAEIIFINQLHPTHLLVKLLNNGEIIDLSKETSLTISRVLPKNSD
ncbi:HD-GYP domain-containing protein [Ureibacillus thermophilus]|nr:HD-GYP domain-containing protein [Ureibacillus thermophilus]